ncbi:hypothetical protein BOTBODRAFT_259874 [Botryobasidium botryosum FD-172 SS1]|uniref:Uncharacterized protein n=1 Tax=Botryobasidium botryosum (strain FD-172 SS1) TaxID=930990 RepID=A0A067MNQ0_BOTB1|nr:hypothetical protein BOTBODRAFT_259874 [Botryobasidium botryosum FD-172 SS1]
MLEAFGSNSRHHLSGSKGSEQSTYVPIIDSARIRANLKIQGHHKGLVGTESVSLSKITPILSEDRRQRSQTELFIVEETTAPALRERAGAVLDGYRLSVLIQCPVVLTAQEQPCQVMPSTVQCQQLILPLRFRCHVGPTDPTSEYSRRRR